MPISEQELVRELRAIRPEPDPGFAAELDRWAATGFRSRRGVAGDDEVRSAVTGGSEAGPPWPVGQAKPRSRLAWTPRLALAASFLAALVVSVGVLASLTNRGTDVAGPSPDDAAVSAAPGGGSQSTPATGAAAPGEIEAAPGPAGTAPDRKQGAEATTLPAPLPPGSDGDGLKPGRERIQERDAQMTLSSEPAEVAEVADGVVEVTERHDGIVVSSAVSTSAEGGRASFDLRIPTSSLQAALADLSDLASVKERSEGSTDITAPYVGAEERFADAKAAVDALVAQLADADSAGEVAEIREQLRVERAELAGARAGLAELKRRADFSRVAVAVVGEGDADGWSLGDAFDDAAGVLEDMAGASLVGLAVILPFALAGAALWFGLGAARRRARERALDD